MSVDNGSARGFDARPLATYVQVAKNKYDAQGKPLLDRIDGEVARGFESLASFSSQPDAAKRLQSIKSQLRYDILAGLNSPANIAQTYGELYRFSRDPQVLEKVAAAIAALRPADIDAFAKKYFTPKNRVSVTLAGGGQ